MEMTRDWKGWENFERNGRIWKGMGRDGKYWKRFR